MAMTWRGASVNGGSWFAFSGSEYPRVHFSCSSSMNNEKEPLHRLMYDITERNNMVKYNELQWASFYSKMQFYNMEYVEGFVYTWVV